MMSNRIAVRTQTDLAVPHMRVGRRFTTTISAMLHRISASLGDWASIPCLPYAAVWEASLVVAKVNDWKIYEPDPFATELPFLLDSWPRG
jgi:hypothetical protein